MINIPILDRVLLSQDEYDTLNNSIADLQRIREDLDIKINMANTDNRLLRKEIASYKSGDVIDYRQLICQENMRILRGLGLDLLTPRTTGELAKALTPPTILNQEKTKAIEAAKASKNKTIFKGKPSDAINMINRGDFVNASILITNLAQKQLKGQVA